MMNQWEHAIEKLQSRLAEVQGNTTLENRLKAMIENFQREAGIKHVLDEK